MPVKRRKAKRRMGSQAELDAWESVFRSYYDFFHDLVEWGVVHPVDVWPMSERPAAEAKFMVAARDAWQRLGASFLETTTDEKPWAFAQFGEPPCR